MARRGVPSMRRLRRTRAFVRRHPAGAAMGAVVLAGLLAFALYWFAPWKLFVDQRVDEAVPTLAARDEASPPPPPAQDQPAETDPTESQATEGPSPAPHSPRKPTPSEKSPPQPPRTDPEVLARGPFHSLEHGASGEALLLRLADGSTYLRFEDLNVSNGPDLRVLLTDQALSENWYVWDDGEFVDLGPLKGNIGDQNYLLPPDVDAADWRTAVVWCRRFHVGFAVASIEQG